VEPTVPAESPRTGGNTCVGASDSRARGRPRLKTSGLRLRMIDARTDSWPMRWRSAMTVTSSPHRLAATTHP